jgi:uncharacterized protein
MGVAVAELQPFVGLQTGPFLAWDAVNAAMIRHWCDAMGDSNPIYLDIAAARAQGFTALVAPPTMLQAWVMPGLSGQRPPGSATGGGFAVLEVLRDAGYKAVLGVNCEQEYGSYLLEGDRIYFHSSCEAISAEKTTAMGVGYFVTELSTFYNQRDEVIASMRFRVLQYRPGNAGEAHE